MPCESLISKYEDMLDTCPLPTKEEMAKRIIADDIKNAIPCGTIVKTVIGNIVGMITGVCIRFDDVQYELSYFSGDEEKSIWMRPQQFVVNHFSANTIGFNAMQK
jgi:hypothetical protein